MRRARPTVANISISDNVNFYSA